MSAFVVTPEHIKELVCYAVTRKEHFGRRVEPQSLRYHLSEERAQMIENLYTDKDVAEFYAGILYEQNIRSVAERYPDCKTLNDLPGLINKPPCIEITPYDLGYRKVRNPVHILKMCHCLEYQSCETDDWKETDAYKLIHAIKEAAIEDLPGYDSAPWEYEDERSRVNTSV